MNHRYNRSYYKSKFTVKKLDRYFKRIFNSRVDSFINRAEKEAENSMNTLFCNARKAWLDMMNRAINTNKNND